MSQQIKDTTASNDRSASDSSGLPRDGSFVRVSEWRRKIFWILTAFYLAIALYSPMYAAQKGGSFAAALPGIVGSGFAAWLSARGAMSGLILESQGVVARGILRTYHWGWDEVDHFELRQRGQGCRLHVHLRDGSDHGFLGFFARSPEEEARGQGLFKALEERLEAEHSKVSVP